MEKFIKSFTHAFRGIKDAFLFERNFKIMVFLVLVALIAGIFFVDSAFEYFLIVLTSVMMLVVEMINTVFEKALDLFKKDDDYSIKFIKDVMAGAAFLASLAWLFVVVLIFCK